MERREFKMARGLLLQVIRRQAGTLYKAIVEGVMNAVDAGATACTVTLDEKFVRIVDNGRGFKNFSEVKRVFEVFGEEQTDEERGQKTYGYYRIGRGQLFAFGRNTWRSNACQMIVDIEKHGTTYEHSKLDPVVRGCEILVELREAERLSMHSMSYLAAEIGRQLRYIPLKLTVDTPHSSDVVSVDPASEKWDMITDEAYIRTSASGNLTIYNLGAYVRDLYSNEFGMGGDVVSRKQLTLNFARNEVVRSECAVWAKIQGTLSELAKKYAVCEKRLTAAARERLLRAIVADPKALGLHRDAAVFTDVTGRHWSASDILMRLHKYNGRYTEAPEGDRVGDFIHQRKLAAVFASDVLMAAGARRGVESLFRSLQQANAWFCLDGHDGYVPYAKLANNISNEVTMLPESEYTPHEVLMLGALRASARGLPQRTRWRKLVVGESATAAAWTDGESYVAFDRKFLRSAGMTYVGLTQVLTVYCHEMAHTAPDVDGHAHGPEFYQTFHDLVQDGLPAMLVAAMGALPRLILSAGRKLSKRVKNDLRMVENSGAAIRTAFGVDNTAEYALLWLPASPEMLEQAGVLRETGVEEAAVTA